MPARTFSHLDRIRAKAAEVEPKWGTERRRRITLAMLDPKNQFRKHDVITFTRKVMRARDLKHFLNDVAIEADVKHIERLLGID